MSVKHVAIKLEVENVCVFYDYINLPSYTIVVVWWWCKVVYKTERDQIVYILNINLCGYICLLHSTLAPKWFKCFIRGWYFILIKTTWTWPRANHWTMKLLFLFFTIQPNKNRTFFIHRTSFPILRPVTQIVILITELYVTRK